MLKVLERFACSYRSLRLKASVELQIHHREVCLQPSLRSVTEEVALRGSLYYARSAEEGQVRRNTYADETVLAEVCCYSMVECPEAQRTV